jgi:hypothetical protein
MMARHLGVLIVVTAIAMVAMACGGGDADDVSRTSAPPSETVGDGDGAGEEHGGDDGDIRFPTDVGNIPGLSDECEAIVNVFLSVGSVFFGGGPTDANLSSFDELPGNLREDAAVVLGALDELYTELDKLGVDLSDPQAFTSLTQEQAAELAQIGEKLETPEFNEASDNLSAFAEAECDRG